MNRFAGIVFGLLMLPAAAAAQEFKAGGMTVVAPWARATPGGAKVGGAYLELKASAGAGDRLVSVSSTAAGTVEIHEHINEGGVM
ncbi:MAG: copper chaperone PCu(A)C, partial [Sphingomonadales bacterium]|nr:copper chaperone PCu(A)C [Sphingomonadales bacterium]